MNETWSLSSKRRTNRLTASSGSWSLGVLCSSTFATLLNVSIPSVTKSTPSMELMGGTSLLQWVMSTFNGAWKSRLTIRAVVPPLTIFFPWKERIFSPRISSLSLLNGGPVTTKVRLGLRT